MLRLILMRHAKSAWDTDANDDHARPLNERGLRDAPAMGERLAQMGWVPDLTLCSDALRTMQTWEAVQQVLPRDVPTKYSRNLYHTGIGILQPLISEQPDRVKTLMAVGHNPGWEQAANWFSGERQSMTTANAVLLQSTQTRWPAAALERWELVAWLRPKEL